MPPLGIIALYCLSGQNRCTAAVNTLNCSSPAPGIGNAVLRAALYMPALSAMRYNPAVVALVDRLKAQGRLKGKQIVIAAMRKLLVLCFGVLKTGKEFDPAMAMGK
jgi:hypothetical protein